ncbi:MAG: hypothetical protein II625_01780 [Bacilli bacterium]|nr:hypothetical protein [Bacilli bacterium]
MKKVQYIVDEKVIKKRKEFYDYINRYFRLKNYGPEEDYVNNIYPFVVDFKSKKFWICDSIKCISMAIQFNKVITIDEFMEEISK